ncbi:hypothetical protein [Paenibacillus polymyxa]|uniref:hypothetical protein n=1 Tax=Paenibacillus polymyxa TaxID=1406 RepID=UPI00046F8D4A|nr:hypothetical protein [Paenibacillus polymyxa]
MIKKWLSHRYTVVLSGLLAVVAIAMIAWFIYTPSRSAELQTDKVAAASPVWKLGQRDDSSAEFKGVVGRENIDISAAAASTESSAKGALSALSEAERSTTVPVLLSSGDIPPGLNASTNPELTLQYKLNQIPPNGMIFRVRILDAGKAVPQMAVFSNHQLSGIIQIAGVSGTGSAYNFKNNYDLYIPKEQLQSGVNVLKLKTARCLYCSSAEDKNVWWTWDDLSLETLASPATEPVHGKYILTGTNVNNKEFYYDQGAVKHLPYVLKWLGIAYSGNVMRVTCASNVGKACTDVDDYYQTLKQYNMQSSALYLYTGDIKLQKDGSLPETAKQKLRDYVKKYGSYLQYYEVDNEPGLFNRSKAVNLAVAKWLNTEGKQLAPHLKTVAPGWAYWPTYSTKACKNQTGGTQKCGDPDGWERDPAQRKQLEEVTDLTNGHAYGESYNEEGGGSFVQNLKTFGGSSNGLAKKMLNTEFGTNDTHRDNPDYGASQPQAAAFDRIMRSQIGFADMFIQHAAFYKDYTLFKTGFDLQSHNPANTEIYPFGQGQDTRVKIMRRLSLAYATHGKPLTYTVLNPEDTKDKMVYVRAVDTSKLKPLAGSGATSDKLLVNLVNFEATTQTVRVRVTMPKAGLYTGERFGAGSTYSQAQRSISGLKASPALDFEEKLGPGEAVQYILELKSTDQTAASAPTGVKAASVQDGAVKINWLQAEGVSSYDVLRADGTDGAYQVIASQVAGSTYTDRTVKAGGHYVYKVRATGGTQVSQAAEVA